MSDGEEEVRPAAVQTVTRTIIERERVISRFYGDDSAAALEFEDEIKRAWENMAPTDTRRKLEFITSNIGPIVKDEINCMSQADRADPVKVLNHIVKTFGERRSPTELLEVLVTLRQSSGETVRRYSHRCKAAFDDLVRRQKAVAEAPYPESLLTSHFVKSVKDRHLARTLRAKINETSTAMSFQQIREAAIHWDDEEDEVGASVSAISHKPSTYPTTHTPAPPSPIPSSADPELKAMMLAMMERMDKLLEKSVHPSQRPSQHPPQFPQHPSSLGAPFNPQSGRHRGGKTLLCFRCNQPGHFARECKYPGN